MLAASPRVSASSRGRSTARTVTGSAVTWKYPSCILRGDDSVGEFYSIAVTNGAQQADTGTKMIHLGKNTRSRIISKGVSAGKSSNTYRGIVSAHARRPSTRSRSTGARLAVTVTS